eukprot:CAMPEP_0194026684 /NCGR_PEP_ID=MMETSP0009_2-20130614/996_1 /TAXON_ID=210454 /ORGANISM="Grammatophora oceanica, Strain CCMP 410" /LENGTH=42 /DNA_ID= /DNA_START= /DNA_END= /DNA_ORIENTATION=
MYGLQLDFVLESLDVKHDDEGCLALEFLPDIVRYRRRKAERA